MLLRCTETCIQTHMIRWNTVAGIVSSSVSVVATSQSDKKALKVTFYNCI